MPLDPLIADHHHQMRKGFLKNLLRAPKDIHQQRAQALVANQEMVARFTADEAPLDSTDHTVATAGQPKARVRVYHPQTAAPRPAYLVFFGGAFRQGGIDYPAFEIMYRHRARAAEVAVVAVDYALAPEHPFPAAIEQAYSVLCWLVKNAAELGIDPSRIVVGGQSAGGNIAAALCIVNRDRANHPLRAQILEVPVLDLTGNNVDLWPARALKIPAFLLKRDMTKVVDLYLQTPAEDALTSYASPLLAKDLSGLPPAFIYTAEYDVLRKDGSDYAARLRKAGVDAVCTQYAGQTHESASFTKELPAARHWHASVVAQLRALHNG